MNLNENISRVKELMGIQETLDKLPQDSYLQLNQRNLKKFKDELKTAFQPYYDRSNGDYVTFRNFIVKKLDKFSPELQDYITVDNLYLNGLISMGGKMFNKGLYDIFKLYNPIENKKPVEKSPCLNDITEDSIKLVGPVVAKTEKDLRNRWVTQPGGKLYRIVLPDSCQAELDPITRAALYVTLEPTGNRIHFPVGIPEKLRGSGLGKLVYLKALEKLGFITSSLGSSPAAKMMYADFLTSPKYTDRLMGLLLQKQVLIIDKTKKQDVIRIFKDFVNGKFTEQKYVEISPDLKNILGQEYDNWYNSLEGADTSELINRYKDKEPKGGDTVIDTRDGKTYLFQGQWTHDEGKPNAREIISLSVDKYKDKYIDASEKSNLKVISPGKD